MSYENVRVRGVAVVLLDRRIQREAHGGLAAAFEAEDDGRSGCRRIAEELRPLRMAETELPALDEFQQDPVALGLFGIGKGVASQTMSGQEFFYSHGMLTMQVRS